jgi:hypothetical protein
VSPSFATIEGFAKEDVMPSIRKWPGGCDARGNPAREICNCYAALVYARVEVTESGGVVGGREVTIDELRMIISKRFGFSPTRALLQGALLALGEYKSAPAGGSC